MIDELKNNVDVEIKMVEEMAGFFHRAKSASQSEKRLLLNMTESISKKIKLLNGSVPNLVKNLSLSQTLPGKDKNIGVERVVFHESNNRVALRKEDKEKFFTELSITEKLIKQLKKRGKKKIKKEENFKKANPYSKFANKIFFNVSDRWVNERGYFKPLKKDLMKSNLNILTTTYISITLLTTLISFVLGLVVFTLLLFLNISFTFPFFSFYSGNLFLRILKVSWVILAIPILSGGLFYLYPGSEKKSRAKKIDRELPFVVIHMGSISGSGIVPTQIFRILALSKEYKSTSLEIKKLLNQINVYGYDLVTALRNVANSTPSSKMAELLNGLSSTIKSGGNLNDFFEKRAQSLLLSYRLERQKFTKIAETFMDIYISVVIAMPMVLLLLLIMISVSGIGLGLGINELSLAIVGMVGIINILFLGVLAIKQPGY